MCGLAHLHELGIIHRDLKPQNVLITKERLLCAKLSDMGISKRLHGDMSSLGYHATGKYICSSSRIFRFTFFGVIIHGTIVRVHACCVFSSMLFIRIFLFRRLFLLNENDPKCLMKFFDNINVEVLSCRLWKFWMASTRTTASGAPDTCSRYV